MVVTPCGSARDNGMGTGHSIISSGWIHQMGLRFLQASLVLLAVTVGCSDSPRESRNRPPIPMNVTVSVQPGKITMSPTKLGAGPISLVITNQSGDPLTIKIVGETLRKAQGPIPNRGTAQLKALLEPGEYELTAAGDNSIDPIRLQVGPERHSSQNDLLLP